MHTPPLTIAQAHGSAADAIEEKIDALMDDFNRKHLGDENEKRFVFTARDAQGRLAGAAVVWVYWDYAYLDNLWVDPSQRGQGTGAQLLQAVEHEARARKLRMVQLHTFSFEAPGFYRKQGYTLAGQIADAPQGTTNHWFYKLL